MKPVSDNLIHFLSRALKESPEQQFKVFENIITNGLKLSRITIPMAMSGVIHGNAVCFTDIPLYLLDEHVEVYGKFGIGFKKSFVKRSGGNPVRYFVNTLPYESLDDKILSVRGLLYQNLTSLFSFFENISDNLSDNKDYSFYDKEGKVIADSKELESLFSEYIGICTFDKETGDLGEARDNDKSTDSYYSEREWRIVPFIGSMINGCIKLDKNTNNYFVDFNRNDVNLFIVPNSDIKRKIYNLFESWKNSQDKKLSEYYQNPPSVIVYDEVKSW